MAGRQGGLFHWQSAVTRHVTSYAALVACFLLRALGSLVVPTAPEALHRLRAISGDVTFYAAAVASGRLRAIF